MTKEMTKELKTPVNARTFTGTITWAGRMVTSSAPVGVSGAYSGIHTLGGIYELPVYPCEACGNDVENGDHVSVQIGVEENVYFHKSCYIDSDNQAMIRSLVVAEDVIGI